jgi:hypothetical protein
MTSEAQRIPLLESLVASFLKYGTWCASLVIGTGLALAALRSTLGIDLSTAMVNDQIVTAGIVLFIALPVLRVGLLLVMFVRRGEYGLGLVAALVLAIIGVGLIVGTRGEP